MTFGPTGRTLYYTTYAGGDGQIRAISCTRGNRSPTAEIKTTGDGENYGPQDKEYQFTSGNSSAPDGDQLTYEWNLATERRRPVPQFPMPTRSRESRP